MLKELSDQQIEAIQKLANGSEEIAAATGESVSAVLARNLPRKPMASEPGRVIPMQRVGGAA